MPFSYIYYLLHSTTVHKSWIPEQRYIEMFDVNIIIVRFSDKNELNHISIVS